MTKCDKCTVLGRQNAVDDSTTIIALMVYNGDEHRALVEIETLKRCVECRDNADVQSK